MSVIIKKSLTGSTIVEVVMGVFLISLGMALTVVVFLKTMDNTNLYVRHQAVNSINEVIVRQKGAMNFIPVQTDSAGIRIISKSISFPGNDSLQVITYSAHLIASGKLLYERKLIKKAR
jgi:hypothetical protein